MKLSDFLGYLDKRFVTTVWLPTQVLLGLLVILALDTQQRHAALHAWDTLNGLDKALIAVAALSAGTVAANLVSSQLPLLTRLYEGIWPSPLEGLAEAFRHRQDAVRQTMLKQQPDRAILEFPDPDEDEQLMPTRFGNVLRAGELHPWQRYRLDAVIAWPRLYACLPDAVIRQVASTNSQVELMIVVSAAGYLTAVLGPVLAAVGGRSWWASLAVFAGGLAVGVLANRGAVSSATDFAMVVRSAFDVHRYRVLDQLGWQRPTSLAQERRQWQAIGQLWLRGGIDSSAQADLGYQRRSSAGGENTRAAWRVPAPGLRRMTLVRVIERSDRRPPERKSRL